MRPRAGHAWTWLVRGEKRISMFADADGHWRTTGEAVGWTRCARCRRPEERPHALKDGRLVCNVCFYYKYLPNGEFWSHESDFLFPYNIGNRTSFEELRAINGARDWRATMRSFLSTSPAPAPPA